MQVLKIHNDCLLNTNAGCFFPATLLCSSFLLRDIWKHKKQAVLSNLVSQLQGDFSCLKFSKLLWCCDAGFSVWVHSFSYIVKPWTTNLVLAFSITSLSHNTFVLTRLWQYQQPCQVSGAQESFLILVIPLKTTALTVPERSLISVLAWARVGLTSEFGWVPVLYNGYGRRCHVTCVGIILVLCLNETLLALFFLYWDNISASKLLNSIFMYSN